MPVSVATMVHRHNVEEFEALSRFIEQLDVVEWGVDVPCSAGRLTEHEDLLVTPEEGAPLLKYATGGSYHGADEPFACGLHLCTVTPGGQVLKCGFYDGQPLGSLSEGLETSWNRSHHVPLGELACEPCEHLLDCKGGCRFRADSPLGKDPVMCALYGVQGNPETK
jgi:radical SAM protein with 4Fe4S-binding SPASM domain